MATALAGLVQERAGQGGYPQRLGLMTQIRADFETMADLLLAASDPRPGAPRAPAVDEVGDQLPAIDRIVLYVDDLDRCPPDRVVEVLEAVHLLLAGRLFVVVVVVVVVVAVAVDPRWLLSSITSHYQALFNPPDSPTVAAAVAAGGLDPSWADGPAQYLEKIFQIRADPAASGRRWLPTDDRQPGRRPRGHP